MKKFTLTLVAALSLSVFGLTGCGGGSGENAVVEAAAPDVNQLPADQQAKYEEAMKTGYGKQGQGN